MKNLLRASLLLGFLFFQVSLFANKVYVKGTIKDSSNNPISNKTVTIYSTDSTQGGCVMMHQVKTNPNGYYIDSISCSGTIKKLLIVIENCNGTKLTRDPQVSNTSNVIEVNFIICKATTNIPTPTNCSAVFGAVIKAYAAQFNSKESKAGTGDSIVSRIWNWGDNTTLLSSNQVDPTHYYAKPGSYTACLTIKTKLGCESKYCLPITIKDTLPVIPVTCKAVISYLLKDSLVVFNSADSKASSTTDSIISRTWYYYDSVNNLTLTGNVISPSYPYVKPGNYLVYLSIKTKAGCESKTSITVSIPPKPTQCKAYFSLVNQAGLVKFNSAVSYGTTSKDSIISRTWIWGDNTPILSGNRVDPSHTYAKSGKYEVALYIKTKSGCESKYVTTVVISGINCKVEANFVKERVGLKKVIFNSSSSFTASGDSIIQRKWKFGDNTILGGNEVKITKEYLQQGNYQVCLQVNTLNGCEAQVCKEVQLKDSLNTPPSTVSNIKIISINPNPVITRMMTNIYSFSDQKEVLISIYDIYGQIKFSVKKSLSKGNNFIEIYTEFLLKGPYYLRVSTNNAKDAKTFYKI